MYWTSLWQCIKFDKISETPIQHEWNIYIHVVIGTLEVYWFNFQQTGSTFSMNAWKSKLCKIGSG